MKAALDIVVPSSGPRRPVARRPAALFTPAALLHGAAKQQ